MNAGHENSGRPAMFRGYPHFEIHVSIKNAVVRPMTPPSRQTRGTRVL